MRGSRLQLLKKLLAADRVGRAGTSEVYRHGYVSTRTRQTQLYEMPSDVRRRHTQRMSIERDKQASWAEAKKHRGGGAV
ncbi:hypothetical protein KCU61_g810, partial [Aureobasidium melanogenum]